MFAGVKPDRDRDSVETAFFHEIDRLADEPVSDAEFAKVKNQMESQFVFGLENLQDRADAVGNAALITGDPSAAAHRIERLRAVTKDDVRRVIRTYLVPENRTVVWVLPPGPARRSS